MPSRSWPLWLLTGVILIGFPIVNFIYWPQVLRSGILPPNGDSIGIPMFGSVLATLVASPLIIGITWLCLRRYNPGTRVACWRPDRPYRSVLLTVLFGAAVALITTAVLKDFESNLPWYEYLWPAYLSLWMPWFLGLRAAAIDQLDYEPTYTEQ